MPWYNYIFLANFIFILYMGYRMYLLQSALNQSMLDNTVAIAMLSTMKEELEKNSQMTDSANEDFIKFLSDSRDWAFSYIENSINIINEVIDTCRQETNKGNLGDYKTGPILMGIVTKLLPLVQESNKKE